ncbi:unnamed protein product [Lathyrus sativus]|nr:unnamed protein product [Lathyrus sativus]
MSDLGILSASHDGSLRLWAVSGEVLMEMVGHTAIVYSVDSHASGLIVSGSENRFSKIWKDGVCVQSIEHPGCVWDTKFMENGDIVTACSDGVVRIWTINQDYFADQLELDLYTSQLSQYKSSRKRVGGLKLEELPGLDALKIPGTSDGQTKVVKEGDNGVAYAWNMAEQKWDKIGEVVDGPEGSSRPLFDGAQYDYVFDVDIGDGIPIRKLPYNRSDNAYDVADKWLLKEGLPLSFREQVVQFILQNSGQKDITFDASFRDPYTGSNAYKSTPQNFEKLSEQLHYLISIMTISKDRVVPSPLPDSWKLNEIFATGIVLGGYLALMTVIFFWAIKENQFFPDKFGVRHLNHDEMMSALYLQVSIVSQALIFVTRSRGWSFLERPGALLVIAFLITQLIATLIAVYANWGFAKVQGIGWGWAGVIWLYSIVFYIPLDVMKFAIRYILSGKAWKNLLDNKTAFPTSHIKDCQTFAPSSFAKPDMLNYQYPFLKASPFVEPMKTQNKWFDDNQFVNVDSSAQWSPVSVDAQESCSNAVLLGFGIVEQCTKQDTVSNLLKSGTAESRTDGVNISLLLDLTKLQLSAINEPQQPFSSDSSSLLYLNDKFNIKKPLLYFLQDSALTSKVTVHLDGQITFMGAEIQMKDLLSVVAESYLSKSLHKGERKFVMYPSHVHKLQQKTNTTRAKLCKI